MRSASARAAAGRIIHESRGKLMHVLLLLLVAWLLPLQAPEGLRRGDAGMAPPVQAGAANPLAQPVARGADSQDANAEAAARIVQLGRTDNRVMAHLDALVNGIGPRLTGSKKLRRAEDWAVEQFRAFGLEAHLEPWGEVAVSFDRGPASGVALVRPVEGGEPVAEPLTFLSYAWTPGTNGPRRAPAAFAPASEADIDARAEALRGCWVLFEGQSGATRAVRTALEGRAAELSLAGFLQAGSGGDLLQMSGRMPDSLDAMPVVPRIAVLRSQYEALVSRMKAGQYVEFQFDIDNRAVAGPIVQNNVIADLRGSELPDEYVIVGGHLDSWDGATGTTDNGTGVVTAMEAARLLAASGARPKRTIRFMLWSGEEQGLLGSGAWVSAHPELMPAISAVLVHDGGTNYLSGLGITARMRPQMEAALAPVAAFVAASGNGFKFDLHDVDGLEVGGASDHSSFTEAGVPGFFWDQAGEADYNHTHHTQFDTFDAARADYEAHSSVVIALAALGIADLPELLNRKHMVVQRRQLGVFLAEDGVTVRELAVGAQAATRGIERGDTLLSVNGSAITPGALGEQLSTGEPHKLIGWKHGEDSRSAVFTWDPGDLDRSPEPVTLHTADGLLLHGDWFMGASGAPADGSALVLLHMVNSDRSAWTPMREPLYRAGIATLALDLRGHGESVDADGALAQRVKDRDPALFNAMDHDVAAAVAWLEARGYKRSRIGLMGASVACSVALRAAVNDGQLAGVATLTPGTGYLGVDSLADVASWDSRPLLLVSSREEADGGAGALHAALLARNPWAAADLVVLDQTSIHGTRMFGAVPGVEQRLADWWRTVLR